MTNLDELMEREEEELLEETKPLRTYGEACIFRDDCRSHFLKEDDSLLRVEKAEIKKLKSERDIYKKAFVDTFSELRNVLSPHFAIANLWLEFVSEIKSVSRSYGGLADDCIYDIWTFIEENSLEDKIALAKAQSKMYRVFSYPDIEFSLFMENEEFPLELPEHLTQILLKQ